MVRLASTGTSVCTVNTRPSHEPQTNGNRSYPQSITEVHKPTPSNRRSTMTSVTTGHVKHKTKPVGSHMNRQVNP